MSGKFWHFRRMSRHFRFFRLAIRLKHIHSRIAFTKTVFIGWNNVLLKIHKTGRFRN